MSITLTLFLIASHISPLLILPMGSFSQWSYVKKAIKEVQLLTSPKMTAIKQTNFLTGRDTNCIEHKGGYVLKKIFYSMKQTANSTHLSILSCFKKR